MNNGLFYFPADSEEEPAPFKAGDLVVCESRRGAGQSYEFGRVRKVTKTGKLRIEYLCKKVELVTRDKWGTSKIAKPQKGKLRGDTTLTDSDGYKAGRGWWEAQHWERYDPSKEYKEFWDAMV